MNHSSSFPIGPIKKVAGSCIYLPGNDIDTDRIIPARFLKCVSFESLGDHVFIDDRNEENDLHPFDKAQNKNASILIVDKNFGCGSSREHAPQALMRWGIRAIIGQSFAEIFFGNCLSIGIPCATIQESRIKSLIKVINDYKQKQFNIDIQAQKIVLEEKIWPITFEDAALRMLISGGWDATSNLISQKEKIKLTMQNLPYLDSFQI